MAYFTTRYQIDQARVEGVRYEDTFYNKFWRETFFSWHIYAQNFHPESLLERTREVTFYRKYDALFKGFSVPEWAQASKREGYDFDIYARQIWDKAIWESRYEQTPMPQKNERLGPNLIQMFRYEDYASGHGSRYFYNEEPQPTFYRYKGRFEQQDKERLYSFKDADQDFDVQEVFGADPKTPEGLAKLQNIVGEWARAMPEVFADRMKYFEVGYKEQVSQEPHHQRVWGLYRAFVFKNILNNLQ